METLLDILQIKTWRDIPLVLIDAIIVYYILYRVIIIIKGTRAAQMLLGLFLVIIAFFLSGEAYLDLRVTRWLLEKFIANFILITVVIFQEDIRRALARAGSAPLFATTQAIQATYVLEEVIKASTMLSERGLGALIVIEREADLSHYEGIEVDAAVSKDLLFSLFVPEHQNPLHDGAVVIQKGRVASAGVVLPLSNSAKVDRSLGTRHRAGIGLSEETDAAVVIVSEESSAISIAYRGELARHLDATKMRELLQSIFVARADAEQRGGWQEQLARLRARTTRLELRPVRRHSAPDAPDDDLREDAEDEPGVAPDEVDRAKKDAARAKKRKRRTAASDAVAPRADDGEEGT